MQIGKFCRHALTSWVVGALLAACAGAQRLVWEPAATLQAHVGHDGSRMLADAKESNLLYVSDGKDGVRIFTYPGGKPAGTLDLAGPGAECSDRYGNVYIANGSLYEFAHGGTTPMAIFPVSRSDQIEGCSVDPSTGDVAISVYETAQRAYYIAIFASGNPGIQNDITDNELSQYYSLAYDGSSDLFVVGSRYYTFTLTELAHGASAFRDVQISGHASGSFVEWDGQYLAVWDRYVLYQLRISGGTATVVGSVTLNGNPGMAQPWLARNTFVAPILVEHEKKRGIAIWPYPAGGKPLSRILQFARGAPPTAMTVSVAPH